MSYSNSKSKNFKSEINKIIGSASLATVGSQGGTCADPYSMHVSNRNFSLDTLHISLDLHIKNSSLLSSLELQKKESQKNNLDFIPFNFLKNGSKNMIFALSRRGSKLYPYVLEKGDIIFSISTRQAGSSIPNASLRIGSLSCQSGPEKLLNDLRFWLECEDIYILSHKVSRFDLCADIAIPIDSTKCDKEARIVMRARDFCRRSSNRKLTGVSAGSGDIQMRIYDKQFEMASKQDIEKQLFFWEKWKADKNTPITRVEFQVRGDSINEFFNGAKPTIGELNRMKSNIWRYLTDDWFRLSDRNVDRHNGHQNLAEKSHFWRIVSAAAGNETASKRGKKQPKINIIRQIKQAGGNFISVLAGLGHCFDDVEGLVVTARDIIDRFIRQKSKEAGFEEMFVCRQSRAILF